MYSSQAFHRSAYLEELVVEETNEKIFAISKRAILKEEKSWEIISKANSIEATPAKNKSYPNVWDLCMPSYTRQYHDMKINSLLGFASFQSLSFTRRPGDVTLTLSTVFPSTEISMSRKDRLSRS